MGFVWVLEYTVNVSPDNLSQIMATMLMQCVLLEVDSILENINLLASPHEK
jgi:hypothetical protein